MFTTRFDVFEHYFFPRNVFITIIGKIAIISLIIINLLVFRKEKQCVYLEVGLSIDVSGKA
jgi:hypothetical protein